MLPVFFCWSWASADTTTLPFLIFLQHAFTPKLLDQSLPPSLDLRVAVPIGHERYEGPIQGITV